MRLTLPVRRSVSTLPLFLIACAGDSAGEETEEALSLSVVLGAELARVGLAAGAAMTLLRRTLITGARVRRSLDNPRESSSIT